MLELLSPVGGADCAEAAIANGANAVYVGLGNFSARQNAENFDEAGLRRLLERAHLCEVKVYLAMNTIVKEGELDEFFSTLIKAWNMGVDAVILQDLFLGKVIHERYPKIILHASTQAGICNCMGAELAKEYGFSRVILARETPLAEIEKITKIIETEAFVQGALCTAFSGQCYFSSFVGGNSGNRGRCKQPCRKLYAYDRRGNEEFNYALSLSDLCVGEKLEKLIAAGVTSFKIEGRMRRAEYVAAAVRYYRELIDRGVSSKEALSDLRRTYNRGNYTTGLAFGQDKRLLSTAVQGHLGEKVGVVKVVNGKYLVESSFKPSAGDGFKILRDGKEIGGASFLKNEGRYFLIQSKLRLKNGDGVFITTDTAVNARVLSARKTGKLFISLTFVEGEFPVAICGELIYTGITRLQSAQNRRLTEEELKACFLKTDGLPADIYFDKITLLGDIFISKGELNNFRREFYAALLANVRGERKEVYSSFETPIFSGKNDKTAVIATSFVGVDVDIAICKASDYTRLPENFVKGNFEKYLYFPPFTTEEDLQAIERLVKAYNLDGIYAENYAGITFAKRMAIKWFAGVGFHLLNSLSVEQAVKAGATYYTLSKEGKSEELKPLTGESAFVLSSGEIKLMDLCYCPFEKTCAVCDKKERYTLTDENAREFPVRRYQGAGGCRFEVYNCVRLVGVGVEGAGKLLDATLSNAAELLAMKKYEEKQKQAYKQYTSGHYKRGVL